MTMIGNDKETNIIEIDDQLINKHAELSSIQVCI